MEYTYNDVSFLVCNESKEYNNKLVSTLANSRQADYDLEKSYRTSKTLGMFIAPALLVSVASLCFFAVMSLVSFFTSAIIVALSVLSTALFVFLAVKFSNVNSNIRKLKMDSADIARTVVRLGEVNNLVNDLESGNIVKVCKSQGGKVLDIWCKGSDGCTRNTSLNCILLNNGHDYDGKDIVVSFDGELYYTV